MSSIAWGKRVVFMGVLAAVGLGSRSLAIAQGVADVPPSTITLDRMDASTRLGVQVGFDKIDDVSLSDGFAMRVEPYAQYILPNRTVGIYGALAWAHAFDFNADDDSGVSNFDVGAFFMPFRQSNLILRAGLVIPSASDSGAGPFVNFLTAFERVTDLVLALPNYTTLRFSASTVKESGQFFFRGDLGLDLAIDKPTGSDGVFLRVNAAAGVRVTGVDLAAELVNLGDIDGDGDIADRFLHTLTLGLRTRGADQFHAGMVFPLDENVRGEIWILSLGYQRAMN